MKRKLFTAMMLTSFLSTPLASFALDANTLPNLNGTINGQVSTNGDTMNVQVGAGTGQTAGAVGQFDWNSFNVGSNKTVNWAFTNNNQTALNRVLGSNMSEIYGKLTQSCAAAGCSSYSGTGKVILINPNGILFGDGSSVNLNSFTASTFDLVGAKNIKDLSGSALTTYANSLNANFGPNVKVNFSGAADKIGALIKLDNSKFDIDKTLIILGKDVDIVNGTEIKTNLAYNYGTPQPNQSFSNVKIITGNGAEVTYQKNGYANNADVSANKGLDGVDYNINIGSATGKATTITSGNVFIKNRGVTYDKTATGGSKGSNINIQNTDIAGVKLINAQLGDVAIVGNNYVDVKNSTIQTYNTYESANQSTKNTYSQEGGNVLINGEMGVNVDNVTINTANSNATANSGDVTIKSGSGNVTVNRSTINSQGNVDIAAAVNANVTNSLVYASNTRNLNAKKNINISGDNEVNVGNSAVAATGNVTLASDKKINVYKGAGTTSVLYAGDTLNLHGADTTLTDTAISYNNINLYKTGKINNVTIKDGSTIEDRSATTANGKGLVLNANGNLTVDANRLLKRNITFDITQTTLTNPGKSELNVKSTFDNQDKITLNSSTGNVSFVNGSNVASKGDINATATVGSVNVLNNTSLNATGDVNLTSGKSFIANSTVANANMDTTSSITGKNINIKTTGANSDIDFNKAVLNKLSYSGRLKLDAARDVKITSPDSLSLNKVDMIAGNSNNITTRDDILLNDVSLKAPLNNVTSATGSIALNDVRLLPSNTSNPAATVTKFNAGQNITTNTGSSLTTNQTKVYMNAGKDINVKVNGVNNYEAGIEVNGKNVNIDAVDNVLAISRIYSDRLTLDANDKFISARTTLTAAELAGLNDPATGTNPATQPGGSASGRAYIQVNEYGGFNLDNTASSIDENGNYIGFYTASYNPDNFMVNGESVDGYTKHFINLPGQTGSEKFLLSYDKPIVCATVPDVPTDNGAGGTGTDKPTASDLAAVRIPLQNELSGTSQINNNMADLSASIVAAAAGISLEDDEDKK